jgi:hypothetical protein
VILTANSGAGLTYQWKKNNANITGETAINYTAKTAGNYKCLLTNSNTCTKTSNVIAVAVPCKLENNSIAAEPYFSIHPNPANDKTNLSYSLMLSGKIRVEIISAMGQIIKSYDQGEREAGEYILEINTADFSSGYYLIRFIENDKSFYKKFIRL